jgi:carboxypeptidase C (cathepsin A)
MRTASILFPAWRLLAGSVLALGPAGGLALAQPPAEAAKPEAPRKDEPEPKETQSVTRHALTLDGARIPYVATAGTLILRDGKEKARASVFYVAYVKDGVADPATRPVTFSFNGGPGAAAVWVQFGAFGPKKVQADDDGMPLPPPGTLVDNPYSILDVTDLVFIDPVGTGLSRPAPGVEAKAFHSLKGDVESVADFIRLWVTRNARWASPKFVAGESYGTTRGAGLALHLQERYGLHLNGLVQVSTVMNWLNQEQSVGNDVANVVHLPSYAAAAWYHKKLPPELQRELRATLTEVEDFALGEYASALLQGDRLPAEARQAIAQRVARYTGLTADYVLRSNLRIHIMRFVKELLRAEGKTIGRVDTRFTGYDRDAAGETFEHDPSMDAVTVGYVTLLNDHLRRTLKYETDLVYEYSAGLWRDWGWDGNANRYVNVAEDLRAAMTRNPALKVLFASGYYDLATPYFDTPFSVAHLGLPESLRRNVSIAYYEAGHMMYIRKADHARFKADVAEFIRKAAAPAP